MWACVSADVQPQGAVEEFMAERVAVGMWRLRRAERAELGALAGRLLEVEKERAVLLQKRREVDVFEQLMVREASIADEAGHREATAQLGEIGSAEEDDLTSGSLSWKRMGEAEPFATIGFEADIGASCAWMRLRYTAHCNPVNYRVRLTSTLPNFGGVRLILDSR